MRQVWSPGGTRRGIQPGSSLVAAGNSSTSGGDGGTVESVILSRESEDPHHCGLNTLLPYHRLVPRQDEVRVVAGINNHMFRHLSQNSTIRRVDSHLRDPLVPQSRLGNFRCVGKGRQRQSGDAPLSMAAVQGRTPHVCLPSDNGPGREIVYPGALYPNSAEHVSYDESDFLQAEGDIVLACPADLKTNSAALRYVLRECGIEDVFALRPKVGEILTIPPDVNPNPNQSIHLLIVRANQRAPLLTDDYLRCMTYLIQRLIDKGSTRVHLPILDPERPAFSLVNLYHTLTNMFEGTGIHVVLHSRVYVSILTIGLK